MIAQNFHVVQISFYVVYLFRNVQTCSFSESMNKAGNTYTFCLSLSKWHNRIGNM